MGKNNIKIDGDKLRSLLESVSGKSIYQVALDCGYSRNLIAESIRVGAASPIIQNVAKLYGIEPSAYELKKPVKDPTSGDAGKQISFDDLNAISREELKGLVKEAVFELFDKTRFCYDEKTHRLLIAIPYENLVISRENDLKEKSNRKNVAREVIDDFNKRFEI